MRRIGVAGLLILGMALIGQAAWAGNPHAVHAVTVTQSGNTLTAAGRESGLGDEAQVSISLTADAQCVNPGTHKPKAANKQSVSSAGQFPVQNGHADFSLTATATFKPDCSPPMTVVFSNILVLDTTNGIQLYP